LIMDTPGLRELQLWEADAGHQAAFGDVESLARGCRFHDCTHRDEPGCAVRRAVADGSLSAARFESYTKLEKELRYLEMRLDKRARSEQRRRHKAIHREMRHYRPRG
jgi:ribosome biogenesis GTPase